MKPKDILTSDFLYEQYVKNNKTVKEIANEFGIKSTYSITERLKKLDITRRHRNNKSYLITKEQIYQKYIVENKSLRTIAQELECIGEWSVKQLLIKYNIPLRSFTHNSAKQKASYLKRNSAIRRSLITKEELYQKYVLENKSLMTTTLELGFKSKLVIKRLLNEHKIPIRKHTFNSDKRKANYTRKSNGYYNDIGLNYFNDIKRSAIARQLEFKITIEYIWELFIQQDKKCAITNLPLEFKQLGTPKTLCTTTASLDRIDNSKGYIEGNLQWLHKDINRMKSIFTQEYFIDMCKKVVDNLK